MEPPATHQSAVQIVAWLLAEERERRGITWQKLADELGVHYVTLWRWRRGKDLGAAIQLLPLALKHCPHHRSTT